MIILYEPFDDVTHNLNIICPTSFHSKFLFDINKPTIILYKKGEFYEPLFYAKKQGKKLTTIDPSEYNFMFEIKSEIPFIIKILQSINSHLGDKCRDKTVNKFYTFKQNLLFNEIQQKLPKKYVVKRQVVNYDGTLIGMILFDDIRFFVPCKPGAIIDSIKVVHIDDSLWNTYDITIKKLMNAKIYQ